MSTTSRPRSRKGLRRFRVIWLAPVLAFLALAAWAFASPVGGSPDDDYHLVSTWCASANPGALCEETTEANVRIVPAALVAAECFYVDASLSAACGLDAGLTSTVETMRWNWNGAYPPAYYAIMGIFAGPDIEFSVVAMRLLNALLAVALITAIGMLTPRSRRGSVLWPWVVAVVPLGLYLVASNNPSSWVITGVAGVWSATVGWFAASGRRKIALGALLVVAMFMALGARTDGAAFAGLALAIALLLEFAQTRRFYLGAMLPMALGVVCLVVFILTRQSEILTSGFAPVEVNGVPEPTAPPPDGVRLFLANLLELPSLLAGVFGFWGLGWFEVVLPAVVGFAGFAAFLLFGGVGFTALTWRKSIALGILGLALVTIPLVVLQAGGDTVGVIVQPRYILPMILLLVGVLAIGSVRRPVRPTLGISVLIGVGVVVANAVALLTTTRRYTTGMGATDDRFWWWSGIPSPYLVVALGALAFAGFAAVMLRELRRPLPLIA